MNNIDLKEAQLQTGPINHDYVCKSFNLTQLKAHCIINPRT